MRPVRIFVGCVSYLWPSQEAVSHHRVISILRSIPAVRAVRKGQLGGFIKQDMEYICVENILSS